MNLTNVNLNVVSFDWVATDWCPEESTRCDKCNSPTASAHSTAGLMTEKEDWVVFFVLCPKCVKEFTQNPMKFIADIRNIRNGY